MAAAGGWGQVFFTILAIADGLDAVQVIGSPVPGIPGDDMGLILAQTIEQ